MRSCTICTHPQRAAIDEAIATGQPYLKIEKRFGMSRETVRRHRKHVEALIKKHDEVTDLARAGDLKAKLKLHEAELLRLQADAEKEKDIPTAVRVRAELRQLYELQAKMQGDLKPQEVGVIAFNLDEQTSRRALETYLRRHPTGQKDKAQDGPAE